MRMNIYNSGIIDIHSHMGVYPAPSVRTSSDGNESTSPVTADVWAQTSAVTGLVDSLPSELVLTEGAG